MAKKDIDNPTREAVLESTLEEVLEALEYYQFEDAESLDCETVDFLMNEIKDAIKYRQQKPRPSQGQKVEYP